MSRFATRFNSARQDWTTPREIFDQLDDEFRFDTDLAASEDNTLCQLYFDAETDGLSQYWEGICWLNPPYASESSRLLDWIKKAYISSSTTPGLTVVMLIPARTNTCWFRDYCMRAAEIRFICGRPKFGDADHGLPQPLVIVVFRYGSQGTKFSTLNLKPRADIPEV